MRKILTENDVNVAIYVRVSTQEQATEGYSIDEQIDRCNKYCEAHGWNVYKVYTDGGYSGANTDRPALKQMLKDIKSGRINKVLVYKLDRLSRSQKDTLLLIEDEFLEHNVDFVSMNENFDTSTPFGKAMIGILAVFAQLEREQIKERMEMGKDARAKEGKWHGSSCVPIGYDYIDGELVINDFERIQVEKAFKLILEGKSPYQIADILNESGMVHKKGKWRHIAVRRVLTSKTYCGYINHHGKWLKGIHDAFIDEKTYDEVQKVLNDRSKKHSEYNSRLGKATSYLGSYLYCACCGGKFAKNSRKYTTQNGVTTLNQYVCNSMSKKNKAVVINPNCKNKRWNMDELDNIVFNEIKKLSFDPKYFDKIKENHYDKDNIDVIIKELNKLDAQISRFMDLYAEGEIPKNVLQDKIHDLNDKKTSLENELEKIKEDRKAVLSKEETMQIVNSFEDVLNRGDFDEIRAVIGALIEKIVIDNDDVTIYWKFN